MKNEMQKPNPLALIMIDIDLFKSINDTYGHNTGDTVLVAVARILLENAQLVCRIGGEEFAVVLPNTSIETAYELAERISQQIRNERPAGIRVTVSAGIASSAQAIETKDLGRKADTALYFAKRTGRNRVEVYRPGLEAIWSRKITSGLQTA